MFTLIDVVLKKKINKYTMSSVNDLLQI